MSGAIPDPELHGDLRAALELYPEVLPQRPTVDPLGLAFTILHSAVSEPGRGLVARRLEKAGVDPAAAKEALSHLLQDVHRPSLALSSSVAGLAREWRRGERVSSWQIVRGLLRRHPEYGGGMGRKLYRSPGPATAETRTAEAWIDAARALVKPGATDRLHGRLLLLALARLDRSLGEYLASSGLLDAVVEELQEPVGKVFLPEADSGLATYGPIDRTPLHADHPAVDDRLGREGFAKALALRLGRIWNEYAESGASGSFNLHLHGPWGAGKSSLLAMMRSALQPTEESENSSSRWIVVDFNAWRHQRVEAPWWQLLDAIYRQARHQLRRVYGQRWKALRLRATETWWRFFILRRDVVFSVAAIVFLAGVLYWVLSLTGLLDGLVPGTAQSAPSETTVAAGAPPTDTSKTTLALTAAGAKQVGDILALLGTLISAGLVVGRFFVFGGVRSARELVEASSDPMARISRHFRDLLRQIDHPVAIFIDDLDRCQEDYVIRLLEGIQTLFNDPRVIYVVAADRRWLQACYESTYARFQDRVREPGRRLGTLFLEKIFQLSVAVPRLSPEIQRAYWSYLLRGRKADVESRLDEAREAARSEFAEAASEAEVFARLEAPDEDPIKVQGRRQAAVERLATEKVEETTLYFLEQFTDLLEPNPRAMKRLLNAYAVHRDLAILSGLNVLIDIRRREQLALWTILSLRWPLLHDYLSDRARERADEPSEAIRELTAAPEVRRVWEGHGVQASLDLDSVKLLIGLGAKGGGASGAVA